MSDPIRPFVESHEETTRALAALEDARAEFESRITAVEASGSSAAPGSAKYILKGVLPVAGLPNAQAMGDLATGIVKNTTTTGVQSIAVEGTDYYKPGGTDVAVADGGTGASTAADARTNLGITVYDSATVLAIAQPLDATLTALAGLATAADKLPYFTGVDTASLADLSAFARTFIDDADAAAVRATLGLVIGTNVQAFDADLSAVAGLGGTGLMARTGAGTAAVRTLTGPVAGIGVSNGDGAAGNPTLALQNDLGALEGLGSTGIAVRSASDTWVQRSVAVTSSTGLSISNGDGVSGNPTLAGIDATTSVKGVASFATADFTVSSGAVSLQASRKTVTRILYIENPAAADLFPMFNVPTASTVTRVGAVVDTGTLTLSLYKRDEGTPGSGTTAIVSSQSVTSTHGAKTIASAGMTARQWCIGTVITIDSGTPTKLWVNVEYTID